MNLLSRPCSSHRHSILACWNLSWHTSNPGLSCSFRKSSYNFFRTMTTESSPPLTGSSASQSLSSHSTSSNPQAPKQTKKLRYADIGINLTDPTFQGIYHDKRAHPDDLTSIIQRAQDAGCQKLIVTGSDLEQSKKALQLAEEYPTLCYATIGIHPCSSTLFTTHPLGPTSLLSQLSSLAHSASLTTHCVAFGEIGLDYDRLTLCAKETQQQYFSAQLCIAASVHLPLFLHSRAAHSDFIRILNEHWDALKEKGGVVHSFTGTVAEMQDLVDMGLYIGVNGCSLKTAENLDVVRAIPLGRMMLETDGPWCEMRPSHASASYLTDAAALPKAVKKEKWVEGCMVKGRNEPCAIGRVTHVVARVKGVGVEEVCEAAWNNSIRVFGLGEQSQD